MMTKGLGIISWRDTVGRPDSGWRFPSSIKRIYIQSDPLPKLPLPRDEDYLKMISLFEDLGRREERIVLLDAEAMDMRIEEIE